MTKTFTEKGIEYLLVEAGTNGMGLSDDAILYGHDLDGDYEFISLLKDITEEQAHSLCGIFPFQEPIGNLSYKAFLYYILESHHGIDTSLNWLLLKKI